MLRLLLPMMTTKVAKEIQFVVKHNDVFKSMTPVERLWVTNILKACQVPMHRFQMIRCFGADDVRIMVTVLHEGKITGWEYKGYSIEFVPETLVQWYRRKKEGE